MLLDVRKAVRAESRSAARQPCGSEPDAPLFGDVLQGQVPQLHGGFLVGKRAPSFDHFTGRQIRRFHRVGGVDHLANVGWVSGNTVRYTAEAK